MTELMRKIEDLVRSKVQGDPRTEQHTKAGLTYGWFIPTASFREDFPDPSWLVFSFAEDPSWY